MFIKNELKCLATAYPKEIETDANELMIACFSVPVRHCANRIYETYLKEVESIDFNFISETEAGKFLFTKTMFPQIHITYFNHGVIDLFKLMKVIRDVINNKSRYIQLTLIKIGE